MREAIHTIIANLEKSHSPRDLAKCLDTLSSLYEDSAGLLGHDVRLTRFLRIAENDLRDYMHNRDLSDTNKALKLQETIRVLKQADKTCLQLKKFIKSII